MVGYGSQKQEWIRYGEWLVTELQMEELWLAGWRLMGGWWINSNTWTVDSSLVIDNQICGERINDRQMDKQLLNIDRKLLDSE